MNQMNELTLRNDVLIATTSLVFFRYGTLLTQTDAQEYASSVDSITRWGTVIASSVDRVIGAGIQQAFYGSNFARQTSNTAQVSAAR